MELSLINPGLATEDIAGNQEEDAPGCGGGLEGGNRLPVSAVLRLECAMVPPVPKFGLASEDPKLRMVGQLLERRADEAVMIIWRYVGQFIASCEGLWHPAHRGQMFGEAAGGG